MALVGPYTLVCSAQKMSMQQVALVTCVVAGRRTRRKCLASLEQICRLGKTHWIVQIDLPRADVRFGPWQREEGLIEPYGMWWIKVGKAPSEKVSAASADRDIDQGPIDPRNSEYIIVDGRISDDGMDLIDAVDAYLEWQMEYNTPPQTYEFTDWLKTTGVKYDIIDATLNCEYPDSRCDVWDPEARLQFKVDFGEHEQLVLVSDRDLLKGVTTAILISKHWRGRMLAASAMQRWHQCVRRNRAARLIQAAWRNCVANPAYQVCQCRLRKEFFELV